MRLGAALTGAPPGGVSRGRLGGRDAPLTAAARGREPFRRRCLVGSIHGRRRPPLCREAPSGASSPRTPEHRAAAARGKDARPSQGGDLQRGHKALAGGRGPACGPMTDRACGRMVGDGWLGTARNPACQSPSARYISPPCLGGAEFCAGILSGCAPGRFARADPPAPRRFKDPAGCPDPRLIMRRACEDAHAGSPAPGRRSPPPVSSRAAARSRAEERWPSG